MISARLAARALFAAGVIGATLGAAGGQTGDLAGPKTPSEWARAIANTIWGWQFDILPTGPGLAVEQVTSHESVVEIRYVVYDAAAFAILKSDFAQVRLAKALYYCDSRYVTYLRQGVVFHEVIALPDHSDQVDFTIDRSMC
jgi:hypothetical protein